jgi:hypothetical protein
MEKQNMTSAAATENSVTKASRSASTAPFAEKLNKDKRIYWLTTGIVCSVMVFSAVNFNLSNPLGPMKGAFAHLGFPSYFRIELTVAKILGVLALLIPTTPRKIKDFAYSGFAITLISASIAHFSSGDSMMFVVDPLLFLALLAVSYFYSYKNVETVH